MPTTRDDLVWKRHPAAEQFILNLLAQLAQNLPPVQTLGEHLLTSTSSRLVNWLDHLIVANGDTPRGQLADFGFEPEAVPAEPSDTVYHHPGAIFPRVLLRQQTSAPAGTVLGGAILVEQVSDFLMTHQLSLPIEGSLYSPYRRARVHAAGGFEFWVVERRGHRGFIPTKMPPDYPQRYLNTYERWATRPRHFADPSQGMKHALKLTQAMVSELGTDPAAWVIFAAERAHWQRRNWAGQIQKGRQDQLGLGWGNHDHHTFRSSRQVFTQLIQILETLGFRPRERFFAGAEAGWGAQVMEQPVCQFAVFADVDMSPAEAEGDFAHQGLPTKFELGTVGLWCALHGESMLAAGLHHLAGRFDFQSATADLAEQGIAMMHPFSEFSYLQQAFTRGERWLVPAERLDQLLAAGHIDPAQRERFETQGVVGSHLENIQRGEGFKGFNQQTVSDIIRRTDPRTEPDNV